MSSSTVVSEETDRAGITSPAKFGVYAGGVEMPFTSELNIVDPASMPVRVLSDEFFATCSVLHQMNMLSVYSRYVRTS